ncbi:MAG: Txe/YoeB family addiction module toxin [Actinomycetes bacterium]
MRLLFTPYGRADYTQWQTTERAMVERINRLIDEALRDPSTGLGKPEPLKHALRGAWSRRIPDEHRLVYLVGDGDLVILQARYHYGK